MRKDRLMAGVIVATSLAFIVSASPAFAVKQFYDEFKEVYVNKGNLDAARCKSKMQHLPRRKK